MTVEFNENQIKPAPHQVGKSSKKGITGWMIKNGIAPNEKVASIMQIGLIIVLIIISVLAIRSM